MVFLRKIAPILTVTLAVAILVTVAGEFSSQFVFNPPYLLFVLNVSIWSVATFAVVFLSAKGFLHDDSLTILMVGVSMILLGLSVITSGWVANISGDYSVAIANICSLVAAVVQVGAAAFALLGKQKTGISRRVSLLISVYVSSLIFVAAVSVVVLLGWAPHFFLSSGPTLLRQVVLGSTVFFFALASVIFGFQYARLRSTTLFWYTLAIALFGLGFFSAFEVRVLGDVATWLGRITLYVANFFLIAAVLELRRGGEAGTGMANGWTQAFVADRSQSATLLSNMLDAFVYGKILTDNLGKPIDWVYLDVNDEFEKISGKTRRNVVGKKVSEVFPDEGKDPVDWIGRYGQVALTMQPAKFGSYSQSLGKWLEVSVYSPKKGYFVSIIGDITERKRAEEALKASEEKYRSLFNSVDEGFCIIEMVFDAEGKPIDYRFLEVNSVFEKQTGLHDAVGKLMRSMAPAHEEHWFRTYGEIALSGIPRRFEDEAKALNRYYDVYAFPLGTEKPYRVGILFKDVAERKKAEKQISDLAKFPMENPAVVLRVDGKGIIMFANPSTQGFLIQWNSKVGDCVPEHISKMVVDSITTENRIAFEEKLGEETFSFLITPITSEGYANLYGRNVTKRKKAEAQIEEYTKTLEKTVKERTEKIRSDALYARNLIEASLDPLVTISADGKITDVNKATEFATGCSRETLIGSDFSTYFTEPEKAEAGYKQVFKDGFVKDYPLALKHKSGTITEVLYNATVYSDSAGKVGGVFAAARDVTERRKLEKQVQDAEHLASIGATAGMVGHDIRNPLQAMLGDVYLAKEDLISLPDSREKQDILESLNAIADNVDYVNKIVVDLQDYSRPLKPIREKVNLESVLDDLLLKHDIPKNIEASVKISKNAKVITSDSSFVKRIIENLMTNALQSMPNGGSLRISAYLDRGGTVISVEDSGKGIPEEVKAKLFTPLFTTKSKGQGFGLAVVKRMTEALGGQVSFESELGKGAKFIVRLPQKPVK